MVKDGFEFTFPSIHITYSSISVPQSYIARLDSFVLQGLAHTFLRLNWGSGNNRPIRTFNDEITEPMR